MVKMPIQKESHTTELKKSLAQLDVALKSVCAFLNHKGGTVYFGVANDGKITGLNVTDKTLRKISQQNDINEEKVERFLRKAKFERRLEIDPTISVKEALKRMDLIKRNKLTNATILLFGKNPQQFFMQS